MSSSWRNSLWGLGCGALFAVGLALSGMTDPARVLGFLDVTGAWDPRLAFVMLGAIGVHFTWLRLATRIQGPSARAFSLPPHAPVTGSLLAGAALFGVGWGMSGYCPGPAIVASGAGNAEAAIFFAAMLGGMLLFRFLPRPSQETEAANATEGLPSGHR
jgi:uncharacterized protein